LVAFSFPFFGFGALFLGSFAGFGAGAAPSTVLTFFAAGFLG
jgi:hypothetical protein